MSICSRFRLTLFRAESVKMLGLPTVRFHSLEAMLVLFTFSAHDHDKERWRQQYCFTRPQKILNFGDKTGILNFEMV